jgi:hypothetical protein
VILSAPQVLDKLSSISSAASSRLHSPAPTDRAPLTASTLRSRAVSPMPGNTLFPPKSNVSATGSSPRGSYASLSSPNVRYSRDLEPETPSLASKNTPFDSAGEGFGRQMRETEESTTPKERERLYASQRAPQPVFTVSGNGDSNGIRKEGSVRVSFSRSRQEIDVDEFGMSKTSQVRQRAYSSESDDRSITPPADASRRYVADSTHQISSGRERRISINEPQASPTKAREPLRTRAAAGTLGRQRNSSEIIERTVAAARKSPVRARGALPSEFRSSTESKRASLDNKRFSLDSKVSITTIYNASAYTQGVFDYASVPFLDRQILQISRVVKADSIVLLQPLGGREPQLFASRHAGRTLDGLVKIRRPMVTNLGAERRLVLAMNDAVEALKVRSSPTGAALSGKA